MDSGAQQMTFYKTQSQPMLRLVKLLLAMALVSGTSDLWTKAHAKSPKQQSAQKQRQKALAGVKSWGYQLRFVDPVEVRNSPYDLMVIDHAISANRRFKRKITPEEVAIMKERPDGSKRIVLSYLSIGEAERYRFYWDQAWYDPALAPKWLGKMNPRWDGNYLVRFWDPAWQALIFGSPGSYIDQIIKQGFDGIYLDRADVYEEWSKDHAGAEKDMVKFITQLAKAARKHNPNFLVVLQNAEELSRYRKVRRAIDAIAKEDLYYGIDHAGEPNSAEDVNWSLKLLRRAKRRGKKIFVVEYISDPELAARLMRRISKLGFIPYAGPRGLGSLWFKGREF